MEAVLMALCGCTSVDVVSILEKKRQPLEGLRVTATATQAGTAPQVFTHIKLTYAVSGRLSRKAAVSYTHLATGVDKKNVGGVRRFVLPVGIGDAGVVEDVTAAELEAAVGYMLARAGEKRG